MNGKGGMIWKGKEKEMKWCLRSSYSDIKIERVCVCV